ncbi:MAG: hypothetical protein JWO41_655 [Candidatus Saccharibacteria bacterium]|nr:hypothetical protein [Candidatus Saccharibacteria bacterium]
MKTSIHLELDPRTRSERLVGVSDEQQVDERIAHAVVNQRRLFAPLVRHLAGNQYRDINPEYQERTDTPPPKDLLQLMGVVRDELLVAVEQCTPPLEVIE